MSSSTLKDSFPSNGHLVQPDEYIKKHALQLHLADVARYIDLIAEHQHDVTSGSQTSTLAAGLAEYFTHVGSGFLGNVLERPADQQQQQHAQADDGTPAVGGSSYLAFSPSFDVWMRSALGRVALGLQVGRLLTMRLPTAATTNGGENTQDTAGTISLWTMSAEFQAQLTPPICVDFPEHQLELIRAVSERAAEILLAQRVAALETSASTNEGPTNIDSAAQSAFKLNAWRIATLRATIILLHAHEFVQDLEGLTWTVCESKPKTSSSGLDRKTMSLRERLHVVRSSDVKMAASVWQVESKSLRRGFTRHGLEAPLWRPTTVENGRRPSPTLDIFAEPYPADSAVSTALEESKAFISRPCAPQSVGSMNTDDSVNKKKPTATNTAANNSNSGGTDPDMSLVEFLAVLVLNSTVWQHITQPHMPMIGAALGVGSGL